MLKYLYIFFAFNLRKMEKKNQIMDLSNIYNEILQICIMIKYVFIY